ncbi:MFS transporter [Commensalibacter oyaizuii]|uniref:MFS transporter n=1 Tax=Commensalibacter oyaizuii TaxID=3043873 RepID=A0ABT6Q2P7_9PROT|nr:MFS transporter [Commensalibacter sp. TBRC 16381]MDI2091373.1 MFS transporter [Commensalibacter sp. TBRC 16381]
MSNSSTKSRMVIGMPVSLFWGYIAVALFMAGDGFEQSFLAHYIHHDLGIPEDKGSLIFSIYGLSAAISSWLSGVFAETFGAKRIMVIGVVMWIILHAAFMQFGIMPQSYYAIFIFYGLRGFAYPLFFYGFFYWVVRETPDNQLASAVGWIWSMFTIGYGIIGYFLPYYLVEKFGAEFTLWQALIWAIAGAAITIFLLKTPKQQKSELQENHSFSHRMKNICNDLTLVFRSRDLAIALIIRAICNFSLFGVLTIVLPNFMTASNGGQFTLHQWQLISIFIYPIQPFTNVLWGIIGDRIGWLKQMRWVGFVGCGTATILLYYIPVLFPGNVYASIGAMLFFALTITSFVPMGAIFPMLAPDHKGAAVSIQNLGGGLSQFLGNALVSVIYFIGFGNYGVFIIYGILYYIAAVLTYFIRLKQPGVDYKV